MEFKKILLEDRAILKEHISCNQHKLSDYSVGNLIVWGSKHNTRYALYKGCMIIRFTTDGKERFAFPMGIDFAKDPEAREKLAEVMNEILAVCDKEKIKFRMYAVEPEMFTELDKACPGQYEINYIRDYANYIYLADDLERLAGKKYHGKKNHLNAFKRSYPNWSYESIDENNTEACIELVKTWARNNDTAHDADKYDEVGALLYSLEHRVELGMIGGVIKVGDEIVAMTMGEPCDRCAFVVHFEKAKPEYRGSYQIINQQFVSNELQDFTYINREEDLGDDGLRQAKKSYRPHMMAKSGKVTRIKDDNDN